MTRPPSAWSLVAPFAARFPIDDPDAILTPREAAILAITLDRLGDHVQADVEQHASEPLTMANRDEWSVLHRLPPLSWRLGSSWRRRFARCFHDLSDDLEAGREPLPRCAGEEAALWLGLEDAAQFSIADEWPSIGRLARDDERDGDWERLYDLLFQDLDILTILRPGRHEGIEDPGDATNRWFGMGDYRPKAWFDWFLNAEPRPDSDE